jgi:GT2 family glycosyltransferase
MKVGLVIASYGRAELLKQLLSSIEQQTRVPDEIVLSVVSEKDLGTGLSSRLKVNVVYSSR